MGKRGRDERRGPPRQYDNRQARKQSERFEDDGLEEGGNIWYGPRKKWRGKDKAPSRCDPHVDAGATRGSEAGALEFCVFFARGACARGYSCHKLHFVPTPEDDAREDNMHDCFGRERSGVEDDDRDGAGCFLKENRTLWVGGVPVFDEASARERVRRNFGPWGRISSVRLVKSKSCAFVQYAHRASAEFAKEAMSNQSLLTAEKLASNRAAGERRREKSTGPSRPPSSASSDNASGSGGGDDGPVLHVRWAAEDPNPRAAIQARAGHAQTLLAAQVATGALPSDVAGRLPGADRALLRKAGMDPLNPSQVDLEFQNTQRQYLAVQGYPGANGEYPNTGHQYPPNKDHQYPNTDHHTPTRIISTPTLIISTPARIISTPARIISTPTRIISTPRWAIKIQAQVTDTRAQPTIPVTDTRAPTHHHSRARMAEEDRAFPPNLLVSAQARLLAAASRSVRVSSDCRPRGRRGRA
ncbi:unnamed protein product [Ectocarpus sp. 12 AP-2014]